MPRSSSSFQRAHRAERIRPYGVSGTISVEAATFEALLSDICRSYKAHGFLDIVLLGDSGGNQAGMENVADALNRKWSAERARVHYLREYYFEDQWSYNYLKSLGITQIDRTRRPDSHRTAQQTGAMVSMTTSTTRRRSRFRIRSSFGWSSASRLGCFPCTASSWRRSAGPSRSGRNSPSTARHHRQGVSGFPAAVAWKLSLRAAQHPAGPDAARVARAPQPTRVSRIVRHTTMAVNTKQHWLQARDKPGLLIAMMRHLVGGAFIALEGSLSRCDFSGIPGLSSEETLSLKRSTSYPILDFVVVPLEPDTMPRILEQGVTRRPHSSRHHPRPN